MEQNNRQNRGQPLRLRVPTDNEHPKNGVRETIPPTTGGS